MLAPSGVLLIPVLGFLPAFPPLSLFAEYTSPALALCGEPYSRKPGGILHSPHRTHALACYALSQSALPLAQRLATCLAASPWSLPGQSPRHRQESSPAEISRVQIFAPARFCPADATPFDKIGPLLAQTYPRFAAHAFVGATGIAVRALAPLLEHKSTDAPVLVLDPAGQYVISLLAGHWGGGNELARHMAALLHAAPVITTASDAAPATQDAPAPTLSLDLLLRDAGLRPVDWNRLPAAQAALLEGKQLHLWDPCRAVPDHPGLLRLTTPESRAEARPKSVAVTESEFLADTSPLPPAHTGQLVAAHWLRLEAQPTTLRVAVPRLVLGLGCRKNVPANMVMDAVRTLLDQQGLEPLALAALATVNEKLQEPALLALAESLHLSLRGFAASDLACCPTPNPSAAAGKRFSQPPFSVCEAAALLAASQIFPAGKPRLLVPKTTEQGQLTMSIALAMALTDRIIQ